MAVPTTEFNQLVMTLEIADLDSNAERLAIDNVISTGAGNELDFGSVNIVGGAADSAVKAFCWSVTAYGANTQVENFRFWLSTNGFDIAGTVIKYATWKLDATSEWVQNATTGDVGATELPEVELPVEEVAEA